MSTNSKKKIVIDEITEDEIEKAFQQVNDEAELLKADDDDIVEADEEEIEEEIDEEEVEEEEMEDEEEAEEEEEMEKAHKDMSEEDEDEEEEEEDEDEDNDEEDEDEEEEEEEEPKKKAVSKKKEKPMKKSNDDEIGSFSSNKEIRKGMEISPLLTRLVTDIEKANEKNSKVLGQVAVLLKATMDEVASLREEFSSQPRATKSRIKKEEIVEKFEKSQDDEFSEKGGKVLHLRQNYHDIVNLLDAKTFGADGTTMNGEFAKALTTFESTKTLPADIVKKILVEDNIKIMP